MMPRHQPRAHHGQRKNGLKQVNFLVGTVTPSMYQEEWDPFWAAARRPG